MKLPALPWWAYAAAGAVLLVVVNRATGGAAARGLGAAVGQAIPDAAAGVVLGLGDGLGVPRTDESECERAIREGRTWDASFACPAGRFIGSLLPGGTATPVAGQVGDDAGVFAGWGGGGSSW